MAAPRSPSRTSTFASQESSSSNVASHNVALQGASTAFGRSTPRLRAPVKTDSGANGALAAAAFSTGTGSNNPSPRNSVSMAPSRPLYQQFTGGSMKSSRTQQGDESSLASSPISQFGLPIPTQRGHSKSPSQQAAALAAARAPPAARATQANSVVEARTAATKKPAVAPKPRRLSSYRGRDENVKDDEVVREDEPTDATSIPPTTSLVDLFERKSGNSQAPSRRPEPIVIKPTKNLAIRSPKPIRTSGGITSMFQMELENSGSPSQMPSSESSRKISHVLENQPAHLSEEKTKPKPPGGLEETESARSLAPGPRVPVKPAQRVPSPSPLRSSTSSAIDIQKPFTRTATSPLESYHGSPMSSKSIPAQFHNLYPSKLTPNLTGDQLANAMVAGSLASSRAPSPKKHDAPPLPSRRGKHHNTFSFSRTPSPAKTGMLQTLRKSASDTEDDEDDDMLHPYSKHKKKRLVRKHPNKHHEGDRKRWRDAVTERERKRYEGVWAANKGIHCSFSLEEEVVFRKAPSLRAASERDLQDQVSNIVTRDIWCRSRLPESTLEIVWDLVDNDSVGRLGKEEFVVGMWLIDQRLKGRKLPTKVSESVWASVRSLQGIKIRK